MLLMKKASIFLEKIKIEQANLKKQNILFFNSLVEYLYVLKNALEFSSGIRSEIARNLLINKIEYLREEDDEEENSTPPTVIETASHESIDGMDEILKLMIETHGAIISDQLRSNLLRVCSDYTFDSSFIIERFYDNIVKNISITNNKINFLPPSITTSDSITDKVDDALAKRKSPPKPSGSFGAPQQTLFLDSSGQFYDPAYVATCQWLNSCDYHLGFSSPEILPDIISLVYNANNTLMQDMSVFAANLQKTAAPRSALRA